MNSPKTVPPRSGFRELLIGCGHARDKRLWMPGPTKLTEFQNLTTLDSDASCKPDLVFDMNNPQSDWDWLLKSVAERFDEVHAYEVLEHIGRQGDAPGFFQFFWNLWGLLKPGGHLLATVPSRFSPWLWGDPGHTRAILPESLHFLDQTVYPGVAPQSDYRWCYKGDFKIVRSEDDRTLHRFILQAVKPARIKTA